MNNQRPFRIKIQGKTRGRPSNIEKSATEFLNYVINKEAVGQCIECSGVVSKQEAEASGCLNCHSHCRLEL